MNVLRIKDWKHFQHYRNRKPPWIKLYRELLDDRDFQALAAESAVLLVNMWLLAAENDGCVVYDSGVLAWRLRKPIQVVREAIQELIKSGFVQSEGSDASEPLALGLRAATTEGEGETEERERQRQRHTTPSSTPSNVDLLREALDGPAKEILEGLVRSSERPESFAAAVRSYGPGGTDGRYTWAEIGQALLEAAATNGELTPRKLAGFLRKVREGEPPTGGAPRDNVGEQLARIRGGAAA